MNPSEIVNARLEIILYNPYHDDLGRFSSKNRAVRIAKTAGTLTRFVTNGIDTDRVGLYSQDYVNPAIAPHVPSMASERKIREYNRKRGVDVGPENMEERGLANRVADFFARKGFGGAIARFGFDAGIDLGMYFLAGASVVKGSALLGAMVGTTLIGGPIAPIVFGIGASAAAGIIWASVSEKATDNLFYGFVNKYSTKDADHKILTVSPLTKKRRGVYRWYTAMGIPSMMLSGALNTLVMGGGKGFHGLPNGLLWSVIAGGSHAVGLEEPSATSAFSSTDERDLAVINLLPIINNVALGITPGVVIPMLEQTRGLGEMGFRVLEDRKGRDIYYAEKEEAFRFLENAKRGNITLTGSMVW